MQCLAPDGGSFRRSRYTGLVPIKIGVTPASFSDPIRLLKECHERVEMFLGVLCSLAAQNGGPLQVADAQSLGTALKYFREAAPQHTADEEDSLFPRLRSKPPSAVRSVLSELARLEQDHRYAASLHQDVNSLGQRWLTRGQLTIDEQHGFAVSVKKLASMYRAHIRTEEDTVFPIAASVLSEKERSEVSSEMAARRGIPNQIAAPAK